MSTVPSSTADTMRQIVLARMSRNESDEKLDNAILVQLSSDTATRISLAQREMTLSQVNTLTQLKELGYDKDSDVVKQFLASAQKMNGVLVKLGDAAARHAS
jgi:hypothetical protein